MRPLLRMAPDVLAGSGAAASCVNLREPQTETGREVNVLSLIAALLGSLLHWLADRVLAWLLAAATA
ncbi:hypothetical protein GCM10007967_01500 [Xylanimonas ulmi]